jgi:hypothetical protein
MAGFEGLYGQDDVGCCEADASCGGQNEGHPECFEVLHGL